MRQVYLLTSGEYSDYRVIGVFSGEEAAALYRRSYPDVDYNDIEIFDLDPKVDELRAGFVQYLVYMERNGNCPVIPEANASPYGGDGEYLNRYCMDKQYHRVRLFVVIARSAEHALKIAGERRARLIAENQWPEDGDGKL
jgi:hypothetical protein